MNSNNLLFTAGGQPVVAADGTLTFTTAPNAFGSAVVSVQAVDDGGTANGGFDTSARADLHDPGHGRSPNHPPQSTTPCP